MKFNSIIGKVTTILPIPVFLKGKVKKKTYLMSKSTDTHINPIITSALNGATTKGI